MKCPSCNKFAALETQEPEVNSLTLDLESELIIADVRVLRNSECCGDEMKEGNFNTEVDIPKEILTKIEKIKDQDPEAEFEAEEGGIDSLEEGGGRYAKSYYGFSLEVSIVHTKDGKSEELGTVHIEDKMAASEMDELV